MSKASSESFFYHTIGFITDTDDVACVRLGALPSNEKLPCDKAEPLRWISITLLVLQPIGTVVGGTSQLYSQQMPALELSNEKIVVRNRNVVKWWHIGVFPSNLLSEGQVMYYPGIVDAYFVQNIRYPSITVIPK